MEHLKDNETDFAGGHRSPAQLSPGLATAPHKPHCAVKLLTFWPLGRLALSGTLA